MSILSVRNNWESLEWKFAGDHIDPRDIAEVMTQGQFLRAKRVERVGTYSDMGNPTTTVRSSDMEIEITVLGTPVWMSLYRHPELREMVQYIRKVGSSSWTPPLEDSL